ncbi:uncharacterized protein [Acropora muricata]|uniref:uncharacterized protein n=1 Tax=Acropora muricata TaxID=159855 RepID=UPI0034E5F358
MASNECQLQVTILASEWGSSKGGLSTLNRELAIQLAKLSCVEITFFLPECFDKDKKEAHSHDITILEAVKRPGYNKLDWLSFPPDHLRIDVVVGHGLKLGRQAQVIRDSHKCKWVQIVHTDPEELGMFKCYENPISTGEEKHHVEVELCQMADIVVGVGPKLAEAFRKYLSFCKKHQDVLEFTPGVFDDFSSVQQVPDERKQCRVLVFGRGDAEDFKLKGLDIAARSIAALSDTFLVFVGAPHGKHEEIAKYFVDFGMPPNRLRVKGYVTSQEDLKRLFYEVDLVLMPSRTEGFGLTGLEALSAGLPVLVSKNSGFGGALDSLPFGSFFVIDSEDPRAWTAAIKGIWNKDKKSRLHEIKILLGFYGDRYNWSKQCRGLIEKMFKLVDGTSSEPEITALVAGAREQNRNKDFTGTSRTSDQAVAAGNSGKQGPSEDQHSLKEHGGTSRTSDQAVAAGNSGKQGPSEDQHSLKEHGGTSRTSDQAVAAGNSGKQGPSEDQHSLKEHGGTSRTSDQAVAAGNSGKQGPSEDQHSLKEHGGTSRTSDQAVAAGNSGKQGPSEDQHSLKEHGGTSRTSDQAVAAGNSGKQGPSEDQHSLKEHGGTSRTSDQAVAAGNSGKQGPSEDQHSLKEHGGTSRTSDQAVAAGNLGKQEPSVILESEDQHSLKEYGVDEMTSSTSSMGTAAQQAKPEYRNWLAVGHALTTELCHGLRSFVKRQTETFYNNVKATLALLAPCSCVFVSKRRPSQYHDMGICNWAKILQAHHQSCKPNWKQSDSSKWIDPIFGPWEIAKLYLPDLGGHAVACVEDMDITNLLNLMYWCTHFSVPRHLIKDVRDVRNKNWAHVTSLELNDADKQVAFDAIENLLKDPSLAHEPDAQNTLKEIVKLKSVSDLHSMEAKVLAEFKEIVGKEIQSSKTELTNLAEESVRTKEQQIELKHEQEMLKKGLGSLNTTRFGGYTLLDSTILILGTLVWVLSENFKGVRKKDVAKWLVLLFLLHCCLVLDDSSDKEGCSMQKYDDPWKLKFFEFTDFIISSREEFTGRRWLIEELEQALEHNDKRGVLLTGNPGSGKSAFLSHLLCSRTSSPVVHSRILAHHFCMHFDKKTQDGVSFVRNLANMIAKEFSEYRQRILDDVFTRRVLYKDCSQDPEWCFEYVILRPLKEIRPQPRDSWYILVDALDECFNEKAEIFNILKSKARQLPKWLKLIVSSRNESTIVAGLESFQRIELRSDSKENLADIDTYLTLKVLSQKESVVKKLKTCLIRDNDAPTQIMVSNLAKKGEGSFQYVKIVLDLWLNSGGNIKWETFPKTLGSTYQLYFERKHATAESFRPLREIFEVLVAAHTPVSIKEMHSMFQIDNPTVDLEYDIMPKLSQVSLFLQHGSEGDGVRIHHASLAEWLTRDANKGKVFYVKKQNGHNRLAKHYLKEAEETVLNPNEAFRLASHVVEGGLDKALVDQFLSLPSQNINSTDHLSQATALHLSAGSPNINVTRLLLRHFSNVDCLDNSRRTPSFIAAAAGNVLHLMALLDRGANLHLTTAHLDGEIASHSKDPVKACKKTKCGFSLLHAAAQEGRIYVVKFLLDHNIDISKTSGSNNTAIQLAAENDHREVVVLLKIAGGIPDGVALHHSSFNGHLLTVIHLLHLGVKDTCLQGTPSPVVVTGADDKELNTTPKVYIYDNHHIHSRETALHAAVRQEHVSVIKVLLTEDLNAINCTNSAGRFPQHEAVYLNKFNSLEALLQSGASASIQCHSKTSSAVLLSQTPLPGTLQQDGCPCGFSPLHLAAKYGNHSVAGLLLKYKADPNMGDCNGSTPLHIAACHGMSAVFILLMDNGADIHAKSMNGSTPLERAAVCLGKEDLFRLLFDLGL